ncbi:MAG TPA: ribonuclease III, partial [Victivallales bacterium]|nr:ribonuclease III [Victivallales bacterium]
MPQNHPKLPGIEEIGYKFKNENYLIEALTHPSYSGENSLNYNNQRLEFLGDSVLQLIVTTYLYVKYPDTDEGELTKMRAFLTQKSTLSIFAEHIKLSDYIRMGRGEIKGEGHRRKSTLCDAFEAVTGAIYVDGGMRAARDFVVPLIEHFYPELSD